MCHISISKVWVSDKQGILQTKIKVSSLDYFEEYIFINHYAIPSIKEKGPLYMLMVGRKNES